MLPLNLSPRQATEFGMVDYAVDVFFSLVFVQNLHVYPKGGCGWSSL